MNDSYTVTCDGSQYEVSRSQAPSTASPAGGIWVIRVRGYYVGRFELADEDEERVRSMACHVIRNGSTSDHPLPGQS